MRTALLVCACLFTAAFVGLIVSHHRAAANAIHSGPSEPDGVWRVKGALSESCTCNVPCTCNFGEGPSPHSYCYSVYSYQISEGEFNGVKLDGLRFGGIDAAKGNTVYLDARAQAEQRPALEALARRVLRVSGDRMGDGKLLGVKYVEITQQYDDRHDMLDLGGAGAFKTAYIMGRDGTKPVVVVNNTVWPVRESIKGKTEYLKINDQYGNRHSVKGTNSNHGDFDFDQNTEFGGSRCAESCSAAKGKDSH